MKKEEADRLRDIANTLDDYGYDIYMDRTSKEAYWFHWGAQEIRTVIMNSGFNGIVEAKYSKVTEKWELRKDEKS